MCHMILFDGRIVRLHIGGSLEEEAYVLRTYRNALFLLMPGLLILSSVSGYFLSRHALKPVDRVTRAALGIRIGNLSQRLPGPLAKDEIQDLAAAWNQLLARLEAAVSRLSQFSADASHDLRTSITVMLATAQLSLHRHRSEEKYRDALGSLFPRLPRRRLRHRLRRHPLLRHQLAYAPLLGVLPLAVSRRHRLRPQSRHRFQHRAYPFGGSISSPRSFLQSRTSAASFLMDHSTPTSMTVNDLAPAKRVP
jgi:signal transduction histidine kinase